MALRIGIELLPKRAISQFQSPWTATQVTVSKRLTFWNRSLTSYGLGKLSGILLQKKRHFSRVRAIWNYSAREHAIITTNPFANMNLVGGKALKRRHPTPSQTIFNIQTLCYEIDDDIRWIIANLSDSEMRLAEVIGFSGGLGVAGVVS